VAVAFEHRTVPKDMRNLGRPELGDNSSGLLASHGRAVTVGSVNTRSKLFCFATASVAVLTAFGCHNAAPSATPLPTPSSATPTSLEPTTSTTPLTTASPTPAYRYGQSVGHQIPVFAEPGSASAPLFVLPASDTLGSPTVVAVLGEQPGWLQVRLPVRPNGAIGWVAAEDVAVGSTDVAVQVDTASHHLTVRKAGAAVLDAPVGLGAAATPTPTGSFYVTDLVDVGSNTGPYGRYAFGLSGHSDVLTEFGGGDGQIALHGTNDPSSIGANISHGCIRVPDDVDVQLASLLTSGVSVTVT